MADNNKAVGPLAAAKLVTLIKALTAKKYDKTGGKIEGSAEITGGLKVGGSSEFSSSIEASSEISSDMLLMAPIVALYDPATEESISFGVSGENAAKVTSSVSGGGVQYARLAVGTPTGDNDAATKAYVDAKKVVYVDFWPTGSEEEYDKAFGYGVELASNQTFDAIFDSIKAGNKTVARYYQDEAKTNSPQSSVDVIVSGDKTLGSISFQFLSAGVANVAGFSFIGETINLVKMSSGTTIFMAAGKTVLPAPNSDGSDNGKVPTINGKKWELKEPSSFVITATLASGGAATVDKTFAQIRDAITGGKAVFMQIVDPTGSPTIHASLVRDAPTYLIFSAVDRRVPISVLHIVTVNSDDSCTVSYDGMPALDSKLALPQLSMTSAPTEDMEIATKKYVDDHADKDAVLYTAQTLTFEQKQQARKNIEALPVLGATTGGTVSLCPDFRIVDSNAAVHIVPTKVNYSDYTITLDCGPENWPVRVAGIRTPTDAQTDYAANVAYVKAKIAEVAASGGVDVDNALSATSTNPVQNKVVTAALTGKASTAVATQSINGLMSKADKTKLDGIAAGATKITIDSAMSGSSNNPVANHVVKQYIDDKVAAAGSNITVDAELSATSTNPVQNKAVKAAIDGKADKTALNAKMDKSGGTFTGNVYGKYFCGTWLQSTAASDLGRTPGKIAVLDDSGWVYYRTPSELFADLGITNAINSYVDTAIIAAINNAY